MNWNLLHPDDLPFLEAFQVRQKGTIFELKNDLLSEPFIGNPETAKVLFLALNPGFDKEDPTVHQKTKFKKIIDDNINLRETEFPYYYLHEDSSLVDDPGFVWCRRIFKELINEIPAKILAQEICCIQFHGYHSSRYKSLGRAPLHSQKKTFELIRTAMNNKTTIVLMRSRKIWYNAIPELDGYKFLIQLNNPRNPTISRGNMKPGEFEKILRVLGA